MLRSAVAVTLIAVIGCAPALKQQEAREPNKNTPESFRGAVDSTNSAIVAWGDVFNDPNLNELIDTALQNNQELNIAVQEIYIANNEVLARSGEYLPFVGVGGGAGIEKVGRYTSQGASDATDPIVGGQHVPDNLPNFFVGFRASWEIDIWKRLRNATKAAANRYLASIEGRNFMVTGLIAEIADSYYELMALDSELVVLRQNIEIYQGALELVRLEKQAARVTELAVQRFEAEVLKNQSRQYELLQQIIETENRINFLVGRFPQHVARNSDSFSNLTPFVVHSGVPTQLLENRPDIRKAELELEAAKLDVKVARALFYPSLSIEAGLGYDAYTLSRFVTTPQSIFYNLAGNVMAPLFNRRGITAAYNSANAEQWRAVLEYERTLLKAYAEVANRLALIDNLSNSYTLKSQQVNKLTEAIESSNLLFRSARADYLEVLTTRRDMLESQMELIELKKRQLTAAVDTYQALGGGWRQAAATKQ